MHGMLSLAVLVAAFAGLAGWAGYVLVRLYRACPAGQAPPDTVTGPAPDAGTGPTPDRGKGAAPDTGTGPASDGAATTSRSEGGS